MREFDVVVVGAGHNGLTAAAYLSKAGLKTVIVERRDVVGGASSSAEIFPGFKYHLFHTGKVDALRPEIIRDLRLGDFGYATIELEPRYTAVFADGKYLSVYTDPTDTLCEIERLSEKDAKAYGKFVKAWSNLENLMPTELAPPPSFADFVKEMSLEPARREMLRLMCFGTIRKTLEDTFSSEHVKAAFVAAGQMGSVQGPSATNLGTFPLLLCARQQWKLARGGLEAVTRAMAKAAERHGASFMMEAKVDRILVGDGQATGIRLSTGDEIGSKVVVSGLAASVTFLEMVGIEHLDDHFVRGLKKIRYEPGGLSLNLALSRLPDFEIPEEKFTGWFAICPSCDYADRAFFECHMREFPQKPILFGCAPSYFDDSLAPPKKHVMHLYAYCFPYDLRKGSWRERKDEAMDLAIDVLSVYAPNLKKSLLHRYALSPVEVEQMLSLPRGDAGHGVATWDQSLFFRPPVGGTDFRTPVRNLYLCGSDVYPGKNTTSGASGYNTARAILHDWPFAGKPGPLSGHPKVGTCHS